MPFMNAACAKGKTPSSNGIGSEARDSHIRRLHTRTGCLGGGYVMQPHYPQRSRRTDTDCCNRDYTFRGRHLKQSHACFQRKNSPGRREELPCWRRRQPCWRERQRGFRTGPRVYPPLSLRHPVLALFILAMRGIHRLALGRAFLAQENRERHHHSDPQELALPVLEGLKPERRTAHEL